MTLELATRINPHIVPLGQLLNSNPAYQYKVPIFQRPYAWSDLQVQPFLEDIDAALKNDKPYYYLGSMVLIEEENDCLRIIDGQQRLATTQILISRIMNRLLTIGVPDNTIMRFANYLEHDDESGQRRDTLVLNDTDRKFFSDHVIKRQEISDRRISVSSNAAIADAMDTVDEFIEAKYQMLKTTDELRNYLSALVAYINRNVAVLRVICSDLNFGYTLFRSLNARGKDLGPVDIIRNHIFEHTASDPSTCRRSAIMGHF